MRVHALSSILCSYVSRAEVCITCRSFREQCNAIQCLGSTAELMQQDALISMEQYIRLDTVTFWYKKLIDICNSSILAT